MLRLRWLVSLLVLTLVMVGCADAPGESVDSSAGYATDTSGARTAARELEDAIEKKEETDVRMGRAVGRAFGLLTQTQRAAYVKAFNELPDVVQIEQGYQLKAQALATELAKVKADPEAVDAFGPRNLLDGYELVAKTSQAKAALVFAVDVLSKRVVLRGVRDEDVVEKVLGPCLAGTFLEYLVKTGDVEQATNETITILETGTGMALKVAGWLQKYNAMSETDVLASSVGIPTGTTLSGLRTIAGVIAIWKLGDEMTRSDAEGIARTFLETAPTAVTGIASGVALFRRLVLGVEKTPFLDGVVRWSGKIATGIGVVTNALALWESAGNWSDSFEDKVRVVGDVLALGASILVLVGAGPVGPVLATVAIGLSFFADWLEDRRLERQEQADLEACLPATGLDATLVRTLVTSEPALLRVLVEDVKLKPETTQWLLSAAPTLASLEEGYPLQFIGIRITQRIWDLDQDETDAMLKAALGPESDPQSKAYKMDAFLRALDFGGIRGDMSRTEANEWFDFYPQHTYLPEPRKTLGLDALDRAQAFLATVN